MTDENKPAGAGADAAQAESKPSQDVEAIVKDRLDAARAEWDRDAAAKAKKADDERADKEAREQGKWKELAEKADADRAAAAAETERLKTEIELGKYLAANHPTFVGSAEYILPKVPAGLGDKARAEAVKAQADEFVKRHPPAKPASVGAPAPRGSVRLPADRLPNQQRPPTAGVASSRF